MLELKHEENEMNYNILIADDVFVNRKLMKSIMSKKLGNLVFYEAENGVEALKIIEENEIDLIILDLMMPEKDGYEVLEELKSSNMYKDIPVIVNSALGDLESIEKTLEIGAFDYFTKPLSKEQMEIILPLKVKNVIMYYEQKKLVNELNEKITDELKNANVFQNIMLPKSSSTKNIELYSRYFPSIEIGGDFYECVRVDDSVWFMIADVTGHGIAAAMVSSMLKVFFHGFIKYFSYSPKEVLNNMNKMVIDMMGSDENTNYIVFTAFIGCIKDKKLTYANAGQPYPILYNKEKNSVKMLEQNGFIVGFHEEAEYENDCVEFAEGDSILVYTDGLFSKGKNGDFNDWTDVYNFTLRNTKLIERRPETFLDKIIYTFHKKNTKECSDDIAVMLLKMK